MFQTLAIAVARAVAEAADLQDRSCRVSDVRTFGAVESSLAAASSWAPPDRHATDLPRHHPAVGAPLPAQQLPKVLEAR